MLQYSNPVDTTVQPLCAVSVTPDGSADQPGQSQGVTPGGNAVLAYRVVNAGNAAFTFALTPSSNGPWLPSLRLVRDTDANGRIDPGEPEVENLTLEADARADLLLEVHAPSGAEGSVYVNLAAACPSGQADSNNVARVVAGRGPVLEFSKTFTPARIKAGERSRVTLTLRNRGTSPALNLEVTDILNTPELAGLTLVPGSALPASGLSAGGQGLEWTLERLEAGGSAAFEFELEAAADLADSSRLNVASATGFADDGTALVPVSARAELIVQAGAGTPPRYDLAVGPRANPQALPGGEGSMDDMQTLIGLQGMSRRICFDHTVGNFGSVTDDITVIAALTQGRATLTLLGEDGAPLPKPLILAAGETRDFQVCADLRDLRNLKIQLAATSSRGAVTNLTLDVWQLLPDLPPPGPGPEPRPDPNPTPEIAVGPIGNPLAETGGEGSASDRQTRSDAVVGNWICFEQTVQNLGPKTDTLTLVAALEAGQGELRLYSADGQPLLPLTLAPEATADFRVCVRPTAAEALSVLITATSELGATPNTTRDLLDAPQAAQPRLTKRVSPEGEVTQGSTLTYTLEVVNPHAFALSELTVTDVLDPRLEVLDPGGATLSGQTLTWNVARLEAGATLTLSLTARVRGGATDGELINTFRLKSTQQLAELESGAVRSPVFGGRLLLEKTVSPLRATVGDRLTYRLRLRNTSNNVALKELVLRDFLPAGLVYLPGTARQGDDALADPGVEEGALVFSLPELAAGAEQILLFDARILPTATLELINRAQAAGVYQMGDQLRGAVPSNEAHARASLEGSMFEARGELVGRVYLDRNANRRFDPEYDRPLQSVRVILADGRAALTDAQGRYSFRNLREGPWALRLDPSSAPYRPLPDPRDGTRPGSRNVLVQALTVVDFPLEAPQPDLELTRDLILIFGDARLEKSVSRSGELYTVTLTLVSPRPLSGPLLEDPLPQGATLEQGSNRVSVDAAAGTTVWTYTFRYAGASLNAITDPLLRWSPQ
nr:hypothetical protein [Deinobacterium chartae]